MSNFEKLAIKMIDIKAQGLRKTEWTTKKGQLVFLQSFEDMSAQLYSNQPKWLDKGNVRGAGS